MAYQVLARKWRPRTFAELAGQAHVVRALSNALTQNRLHHAYLFTGTRGVGKTTVARILAKALNCETGITATPCGICSACTQIDAGRFVDLLELDAASNTGIDNMREVLDNAQYAPTVGRYKVYIIDEVHMLSKAAFNSMLKTLEEPPEHVKFILATTDPQKIPITVLSRCLQFNLKQMPPELVREHLTKVLTAENVEFQAAALPLIARAAQGSMRDALSLLDQAIAYGSGVVLADTVQNMLGTIDQRYLFDLLNALINQDGIELLQLADNMATRSIDFDAALQDLAALLQQIALIQVVPNALSDDTPDKDTLIDLAQRIPAQMVQLYYQICLHGRRDLALAPDEFAGFSMTLLRMLAFYPQADNATAPSQPVRTAVPVPLTPATPKTAPPVLATPPISASAPVIPTVVIAPATSAAVFNGDWNGLVTQLKLGGLARMLAVQCELLSFDEDRMQLCVSAEHKHLIDKTYQDKLRESLNSHFNRNIRLDISVAATAIANTPIQQQNDARAERQTRAEISINAHPFTQDAINLLDARATNIQPIDQSTSKE
ncbi:MAG: DNA polymerase III subunit gamma/tau [Sulfuriferula sp.]